MIGGVGGPIFFTPLFVLVLQLPPAAGGGVALLTQFFGFLSGSIGYWKHQLIDFALGRRLLVFALPAAAAGSLMADRVSGPVLRQVFGIVSIFVAWRVYASRRDRARTAPIARRPGEDEPSRVLVDRSGKQYRYRVCRPVEGTTFTAVGAALLGMISVGLAELQGHHLIVRCRMPTPVAVATTVFVVATAVSAASVGHMYSFMVLADEGTLSQVARILAFTVPGVLIGGQIGPWVQTRLSPDLVKLGIALLLFTVGMAMLAPLGQ